MALPKNVDLKRLGELMFGLAPDDSPDAVDRWMVTRLATTLEVPSLQMEEWMRQIKETLQEWLPDEGEPFHPADAEMLFGRVLKKLPELEYHLQNVLHIDVKQALVKLFFDSLQISPEDLPLILILMSRGGLPEMPDLEADIVRATRFFQQVIPHEQRHAVSIWRDRISIPLSSLRPLDDIEEMRSEDAGENPRHFVLSAMRSHAEAYEASVFEICRYLWMVSRGPSVPVPTKGGNEVKRTVWNAARKFCRKQGIDFPFFAHLPVIRNAQAHQTYRITAEGDVEFTSERPPLVLSSAELVRASADDLVFVLVAQTAYTRAIVETADRMGAFDESLARLTAQFPDLVAPAVDGEPGTRAREAKRALKMSLKIAAQEEECSS